MLFRLSAFLLFFGFYLMLIFYAPDWLARSIVMGSGNPVEVLVSPGMNARQAAEEFFIRSAVRDVSSLSFWLTKLGVDRELQPGVYSVRPGSAWEVASQIRDQRPHQENATIIPGSTFHELCESFGDRFEQSLLDDRLFPEQVRQFLPARAEDRVAFLLPETYAFSSASTLCGELVAAASKQWWRMAMELRTLDYWANRSSAFILDLATMASLVEREAVIDEERPVIAGVLYNRLEKNMPLQVDATVVFAWSLRGRSLTRVLFSDLKIESDYNTYMNRGLPPGPICVPSRQSWDAAIFPDVHKYLYYVLASGQSHVFSRTYEEHLKAIRERNSDR